MRSQERNPGTAPGESVFCAALDADAQLFYTSERGEFGDADAQPRRLEIPEHQIGDGFRGMFQQ